MSDALRAAAQALVDRWDTPAWKESPHTAVFIDALRAALKALQPVRLECIEYNTRCPFAVSSTARCSPSVAPQPERNWE